MKIHKLSPLVVVTLMFLTFTAGFYFGRNPRTEEIQVIVAASAFTQPTETTVPAEETTEPAEVITFPININTADIEHFMALPGIGEVLAERILAYREEHGAFSRVEELMKVEGIGQKRMEELIDLVTTGG